MADDAEPAPVPGYAPGDLLEIDTWCIRCGKHGLFHVRYRPELQVPAEIHIICDACHQLNEVRLRS
jgi:hypothetical protein